MTVYDVILSHVDVGLNKGYASVTCMDADNTSFNFKWKKSYQVVPLFQNVDLKDSRAPPFSFFLIICQFPFIWLYKLVEQIQLSLG